MTKKEMYDLAQNTGTVHPINDLNKQIEAIVHEFEPLGRHYMQCKNCPAWYIKFHDSCELKAKLTPDKETK